jgi:hypothetical protein
VPGTFAAAGRQQAAVFPGPRPRLGGAGQGILGVNLWRVEVKNGTDRAKPPVAL